MSDCCSGNANSGRTPAVAPALHASKQDLVTGSKITAPVLGWVEDSVIRSDSPAVGVAESFS
jgi:hypothetical protein